MPAIHTYEHNLTHLIKYADLNDEEVKNEIASLCPDLIAGGPPCQDFSSAGKRDEDLGRGDLTTTFASIIVQARPRYFIMENVARITATRKLKEVIALLNNAGYHFFMGVLDASYYGVPQARKRFFMVGGLDFHPYFFENILKQKATAQPLTVRDYFGQNFTLKYYYRHPRSYARRGVFSVDEPSPTIRGVNRPLPAGYPGHSSDAIPLNEVPDLRPLSTRERASIQTFPQDFVFVGSKSDQEQMIGNAVPVKLATAVGEALTEYIKEHEFHKLSSLVSIMDSRATKYHIQDS